MDVLPVNARRLSKRDKTEWVSFKTTPIVEQSPFDAAQERLDRNGEVLRRAPKRFYLLGGMVECEICGRPYVTQTKKAGKCRRINDAQSYRHRKSQEHCRNHYISARKLEPIVWEKVEASLRDPEKLLEGYRDSLEQQAATAQRKRVYLETGLMKIGSKQRFSRVALTSFLFLVTVAVCVPGVGIVGGLQCNLAPSYRFSTRAY